MVTLGRPETSCTYLHFNFGDVYAFEGNGADLSGHVCTPAWAKSLQVSARGRPTTFE